MTKEELENKIRIIEHDYAKEINLLKEKNYRLEVKFESLLRYLIWEGDLSKTVFTLDRYQEAVTAFQLLNAKVQEINKLPTIPEKVKAAEEFNSTTKFIKAKIYADDLGLKSIIEKAGGTSGSTATDIIASLPCSKELTSYLKKFIIPDCALEVLPFPKPKIVPGENFPS